MKELFHFPATQSLSLSLVLRLQVDPSQHCAAMATPSNDTALGSRTHACDVEAPSKITTPSRGKVRANGTGLSDVACSMFCPDSTVMRPSCCATVVAFPASPSLDGSTVAEGGQEAGRCGEPPEEGVLLAVGGTCPSTPTWATWPRAGLHKTASRQKSSVTRPSRATSLDAGRLVEVRLSLSRTSARTNLPKLRQRKQLTAAAPMRFGGD